MSVGTLGNQSLRINDVYIFPAAPVDRATKCIGSTMYTCDICYDQLRGKKTLHLRFINEHKVNYLYAMNYPKNALKSRNSINYPHYNKKKPFRFHGIIGI